ncbi:MAG: DUF4340 domain-containing protein [Nitrosomonas sp.]|uniref:DUF4340 domain-containing protein n=1 Tax=Nitrosomonas sp. TaxID=42353 RepID=UPI0025EAAD05|nr:DUF4340 domain-containing protein [Nitrosomonas sp.]UJP02094.1 MAG: DUF4340 domain-containing protein [Nitrosomonas sp.]
MTMTHHARLNLIMVATIGSLLLFLYFKPQSHGNPEYSIASNSAETVQSVHIVRPQQEITLKRLNDHWYLTTPLHARANEEKIRRILEILQAKSQQRFPLTDLGRFGLERPNVLLTVDRSQFGFGGFAPTTNQQYVAAGDHVYLIAPRHALALPGSVNDLIDSRLLASGEIPVKFELPHFAAEFHHPHWRVTLQRSDHAVTDTALKDWIQLWRTASAAELIVVSQLGSDFVATGVVKIGLQDGRQIDLKILHNAVSIVLVRSGEETGYRFPLDTGRHLLDPATPVPAETER